MLLAEIEIYHSRPIAPTRRVALGNLVLPCDPAPGLGGVLLGAIAARFTPELDPDLVPELVSLTHEIEADRRIPQPRLRHRLQEDRVGLTRSPHRLYRHDEDGELSVSFTDDKGLPGQMVNYTWHALAEGLKGEAGLKMGTALSTSWWPPCTNVGSVTTTCTRSRTSWSRPVGGRL